MPVSRDILSDWLDRCDVNEVLEPDDPRYVRLEDFERDGVVIRGGDWTKPLFDCITLARSKDTAQLFSGYIGTGKSTELRRLQKRLQDAGYVVLLADAEQYHDLAHPILIEDLVVIIAGAFGEQAAAHVGEGVLGESYWNRFLTFLDREIDLGDVPLPGLPVDLKASLRHGGAPFWLEVQRALAASMGKLREDAHDYIRRCVAALRKKYRDAAGVVFILDSLERLRGAQDRFREIMDSVGQVFDQRADLLHLPGCHVVYTVPPYAEILHPNLSRLYARPIHKPLPAVKVVERGPELTPYTPGIEALIEVVARRVPIDQVFAGRRDLLERLVLYSGGHVRTLLSFVRELLLRSVSRELPPTDELIEDILRDFAENIRIAVRPEGVRLLDSVRRNAAIDEVPESELPLLARYIDSHIVLCYRNGEGWYEVHPLIRDYVARRARD